MTKPWSIRSDGAIPSLPRRSVSAFDRCVAFLATTVKRRYSQRLVDRHNPYVPSRVDAAAGGRVIGVFPA